MIDDTLQPKDFDLAGFLSHFRQAQWTARVPMRGDLVPRITALQGKLEALSDAIGADEDPDESVADAGGGKRAEFDELYAEYESLLAEFEREHMEFVFRPNDSQTARAARDAAEADGWVLEPHTPEQESDAAERGEQLPPVLTVAEFWPYLWAQTCIRPEGITAQAFQALRAQLGDAALYDLQDKWEKANTIAGPAVEPPFSRGRSRGPHPRPKRQ